MTDALFRKDLRLLRPVIWAAVALGVICYVVGPTLAYIDWRRQWTATHGPPSATPEWRDSVEQAGRLLEGGSTFMWGVYLLLAVTVAGMAFAVERRERWADFAAMLPVPRRRAVFAKSRASVVVVVAMLAVNVAVFAASQQMSWRWDRFWNWGPAAQHELIQIIETYVAWGTGMIGVAWLLSSVLRSAVISTCVGICSVLFVWCYFMFLDRHPTSGTINYFALWREDILAIAITTFGLVAAVAGCVVQLHRRSP